VIEIAEACKGLPGNHLMMRRKTVNEKYETAEIITTVIFGRYQIQFKRV
jgi:hypothetical protein